MKKYFPIFLASLFILFTFSSCKNFMGGADILEQLEDTIDFLSAPYVNVVITADNQATQSISPAVGSYAEKYKNTSRVSLSFEETENYQFTNWVVEPDEAVKFDEATAKSTIAIIQTEEESLTIYPKVYKRPELSISPSNLIVSPKNTSVVITFNHKMEISEEQLQSIDIQFEGLSIINTFKTPVLSITDDATSITFMPDRSKLVNVETASAKVDVIIPAGFSYKSDTGFDISTNKQTVYSYKISNETLDKAKINFSTSAAEGELSFSENQTYSLDQEVSSTFTPTSEYLITGWKVVYENGEEVDPSIVLKTVSTDLYTVTIKLLTGSERQITVKPICEKRKAVTFTFASSQGTLSMSGEKKFYSGDVFSINYTESSDYAFTGWSVYSNGATMPSTNVAQILSFDDSSKKDVKITIKEINQDYNLQLIAENLPRPTVDISPKNVVTVAKNTAISIDFMRKMEISEKQLESIDIQISNLSIKDNFNAPEIEVIDGKTVITFIPKRTNLITLEAATATVNVIIPEGFYYLSPTGQKIATIEKTVYAYKINNETLDKATITVASTQGTLSYSGTKDYFLDDEFTISFTPSQEYEITGWGAYYADNTNTPVSPNTLTLTTAPNDITTVTAKLISGSDKLITLKPICKDCNYIQASFIAEHGYVSPTESKKIYSGKSLSLSFRQDTAFAFLNWQILNTVDNSPVTPEQFASLFELDTSALETELKVKELSQNYSFKFVANCAERAQILSTSPLYNGEGTFRDSRIMVMFDHAMSEDSIYFTSDEITKLKSEKGINDYNFLPSDAIENGQRIYGYIENDEIYYKNITITNYKTNKNILSHFGAPTFESPTVLVIPTQKGNAPIAGTQIFVTIDSNIFYKEDNIPISLASSKKWNYLVNSKEDSTPPKFEETTLFTTTDNSNTNVNKIINHQPNVFTSTIQEFIAGNESDRIEKYFSKPSSLELMLELTDTGSGASSVIMHVTNISSNKTTEITIPLDFQGTNAYYGTYNSSNGTYSKKALDLTQYVDFSMEGTNVIWFTGKDKNDNESTSDYYYFLTDTTAPSLSNALTITTGEESLRLDYTYPTDDDFDKLFIKYKPKGSTDEPITITKGITDETTYTITGLTKGTTYDFTTYVTDIWENESNHIEISKNTKPDKPNFTTSLTPITDTSSVTLDWEKPNGNYSGAKLVYTEMVSSQEPITQSLPINDSELCTKTINGLTRGKKYKFELYSIDNENNESSTSSELSTILRPEPISNFINTAVTTTSVSLAWKLPNSYSSGIRFSYVKTNEKDNEANWVTTDYTNRESITIDSLIPGTNYTFAIKTFTQIDETTIETSNLTDASTIAVQTKESPLLNLHIVNTSTSSIELAWNYAQNASYDSLKIKYNTIPATTEKTDTIDTSTEAITNYSLTNLIPGTKYSIQITPTKNGTDSDVTDIIAFTNPNAVGTLSATPQSSSSITVYFTAPSVGSYENVKIYYSTLNPVPSSAPSVTSQNNSVSVTINNLQLAGTKYYFKAITQTNNGNTIGLEKTTSCGTKPNVVSNLTTSTAIDSVTTKRTITVSWSAPATTTGDYDSVRVYYGTETTPNTNFVTITKAQQTNGTGTTTITGLTAGTKYYFRVVTVKTIDDNEYLSNYVTTSTTTTPNGLASLTATTNSTTGITLNWTYPSVGNYAGVRIYRKTLSSNSYTYVTSYSSSSTTYTTTTLSTGTIYEYKVVPYAGTTSSPVESDTIKEVRIATKPAAVKNITLSNTNTYSSKVLSWSPSSGSITGVNVYYRIYGSSSWSTLVANCTSTSTTIVDSKLNHGEKYEFKIEPYLFTTSNIGAYATQTFGVKPDVITGLTATTKSSSSIQLSWTGVCAYYYEIWYKKQSESSYVRYASPTETTYTLTGLSPATKYQFKIKTIGKDTSTSSDYSSVLNWYTHAAGPSSNSIYLYYDDGQGRIKLRWTQPTGEVFDDVDLYINDKHIGEYTNAAGTVVTTNWIQISNFSRTDPPKIIIKPYIKQVNSSYGHSDVDDTSWTYDNTDGDLIIEGAKCSYTRLKNVITSTTTISGNTSHTDGVFPKGRTVKLSPYSIGAFEVTNELYKKVTGSNPSLWTGNYYPAENMNWYQACWFCNKLSNIMGLTPVYKLNGYDISTAYSYSSVPTSNNTSWNGLTYNVSADGYRLPTEAEWEFAARGGSMSASDWTYNYAGSNTRDTVAWSNTNATTTHKVGEKDPNRLGLYDMSGNVWEYLSDWNYNVPDSGTYINPYCDYKETGNLEWKSPAQVLVRGGSYTNDTNCYVYHNKTHPYPEAIDSSRGFRIMRPKTCN